MIAAIAPWHEVHHAARRTLTQDDRRLPAHVAYETVSALSRMPEGRRIAAEIVFEAVEYAFPQPWLALDGPGLHDALRRAVAAGVRGGPLYDALIAATAGAHRCTIVSADRRALNTYRAMNVPVELIDDPGPPDVG